MRSSPRKEAIPGEAYVPPALLLALAVAFGLAATVLAFTENEALASGALAVFGLTLVAWIVSAAVGAFRSGVSVFGVLWMSVKNLFRLLFDFLP